VADLSFLADWYVSHCDGDWEHGQGIRLTTLDNPGWHLTVNVEDTELAGVVRPWYRVERTEHDWLHHSCDGQQFVAACGPRNLGEALAAFEALARSVAADGPAPR
jgi:hypothetical protein